MLLKTMISSASLSSLVTRTVILIAFSSLSALSIAAVNHAIPEEPEVSFSDVGPEYLSSEPENLDEPSEASFQITDQPFFEDDQLLSIRFRTYYRDKTVDDGPDQEAWAAGGWIDWQSPSFLNGTFKLGATLFGSQKIIGDKNKGGTGLLKPVQESFGGLSNLYGALDFGATTARLGRFEIETPYLNRSDSRMIPNSFQGGQVLHDFTPHWTLGIGYYTDIKPITNTDFISLYDAAGVPGSDRYGVTALGLRFDDPDGWDQAGGLFYRHAPNFMDIYYADYGQRIFSFNDSAITLAGQYTRQESVGTELDGSFKIDQFGAKASWQNSILSATVAFTYYSKADGVQLRSPWGSIPGYTAVITQDFNRPGEKAVLVGLGVDFSNLGVPGLVLSTSYTYGNTPDSGVAASPDQEEFDVTLAYAFQQGLLDGFDVRVRNGYVNQKNTNSNGPIAMNSNDLRVIVNYVWAY